MWRGFRPQTGRGVWVGGREGRGGAHTFKQTKSGMVVGLRFLLQGQEQSHRARLNVFLVFRSAELGTRDGRCCCRCRCCPVQARAGSNAHTYTPLPVKRWHTTADPLTSTTVTAQSSPATWPLLFYYWNRNIFCWCAAFLPALEHLPLFTSFKGPTCNIYRHLSAFKV